MNRRHFLNLQNEGFTLAQVKDARYWRYPLTSDLALIQPTPEGLRVNTLRSDLVTAGRTFMAEYLDTLCSCYWNLERLNAKPSKPGSKYPYSCALFAKQTGRDWHWADKPRFDDWENPTEADRGKIYDLIEGAAVAFEEST